MNDNDKPKEELTKELQELHKENNFLTALTNIDTTKRTQIEQELIVAYEENPVKKLTILIVEDDEQSSRLISIIVRNFGKEIINVQTGTEAVKACRNNPDIDLVLMDIQLPEMDGYEATRQIRKFNTNIVIIAQTGYALTGDREKAIDAGCNNYISKPFKKVDLLALIHKYFSK